MKVVKPPENNCLSQLPTLVEPPQPAINFQCQRQNNKTARNKTTGSIKEA